MSRGITYSVNSIDRERAKRGLRQLQERMRREAYINAQQASQGCGAMAVIHTTPTTITPESPGTQFPPTFKVNFLNLAGFNTGCAILESPSAETALALSRARIVVHRDGDLRFSGLAPAADARAPLLEFDVDHHGLCAPLDLGSDSGGAQCILSPLPELLFAPPVGASSSAGDMGVVGRRVSVLDDRMQLIGDGVMGWC